MVIGLLKIELYVESSRSLKDKRKIIKSLIQKLKSKYTNLSVSEIDFLNNWKKSIIAIVAVSNEIKHINSVLEKALKFILDGYNYQVIDSEIEIIKY